MFVAAPIMIGMADLESTMLLVQKIFYFHFATWMAMTAAIAVGDVAVCLQVGGLVADDPPADDRHEDTRRQVARRVAARHVLFVRVCLSDRAAAGCARPSRADAQRARSHVPGCRGLMMIPKLPL